jgi:hypothetical protein
MSSKTKLNTQFEQIYEILLCNENYNNFSHNTI